MAGTPTDTPNFMSSRMSGNGGQSPVRGMAQRRDRRLSSSRIFESAETWLRIGRGGEETQFMPPLSSLDGDNNGALGLDSCAGDDGSTLHEEHQFEGRSCSSSVLTYDSVPSSSGISSGPGVSDSWRQEFRHHSHAAFQEWQHEAPPENSDSHPLLVRNRLSTILEMQSGAAAKAAGPCGSDLQASVAFEVASNSTTTDTDSEAPPDDVAVSHMLAERKRRRKQNDSLQMLRDLVPNIRKKDKASVLGHTVEYLKQLTTERQELLERRRELQAVIQQQEKELNQLRPSVERNPRT